MDGQRASRSRIRPIAGGLLLLWIGGALALAGCMPDIGTQTVPEAMEFDPGTGRVPQPTVLVINPATGKIDMSLAGVTVPADCLAQTAMPVAQCEFYQYLQSLDGFPTTAGAIAPATAALIPASLKATNVVVVDIARQKTFPDLAFGVDEATKNLTIDPTAGWDVGALYVGAVRGYANGVKAVGPVEAVDGIEVVASSVMFLLKEETSLMCGAATAADIPASCPYMTLLTQQMPDAEARASLVSLEAVRQGLGALGAFGAMTDLGGMPKAEQAVLWAFPTHSASVIELDPTKGLLPKVNGTREIRLKVKGEVDPATVTAWSLDAPGTVFLLDLTALANDDLGGGLPAFSVAVADGALVLTADADLPDGHTIATLVTTGVKNPAGVALVAPPITVLLKSRGPLVDAQGHSQVPSDVSDGDAAQLEGGRADFATLLDDELFASLTGLARADLAYVYGFNFPNP